MVFDFHNYEVNVSLFTQKVVIFKLLGTLLDTFLCWFSLKWRKCFKPLGKICVLDFYKKNILFSKKFEVVTTGVNT